MSFSVLPSRSHAPRARAITWGGAVILIVLLGLAIWKWSDWRASAAVRTAYVARLTCSCLYVEGRSEESCAQDVAPESRMINVTEIAPEKKVRASMPVFATAEALFKEGYGCLMVQ